MPLTSEFKTPVKFLRNLTRQNSEWIRYICKRESHGAGEENRTPVNSLEGCRSTIELHPPKRFYINQKGQNRCRGRNVVSPPTIPLFLRGRKSVTAIILTYKNMVGREGFEPSKA